jgi:protein TonB
MSRGLPWSVFLHVLLITLTVLYGNTVQRRVYEPPMVIRARLVPTQAVVDQPAETPVEAEPEPAPPAAVEPDLPPKEVPVERPKPQPQKKPEKKPEVRPEPKPTETKAPSEAESKPVENQAPTLGMDGPKVSTDQDFPFAYYIANIESQIARNWRPWQPSFGERKRVSCAVHFVIARNGTISQINLVQSSGLSVYDREALRAVQATRLMPLPPQWPGSSLGVTFIFNVEPKL